MNYQFRKNIYYKKASDKKSNPDVEIKKNIVDKDRNINVFEKSNNVYFAVTDNVPQTVRSQNDLVLPKDKPINNLQQMALSKLNERNDFINNNMPIKQKILVDESTTKDLPANLNLKQNYAEENNKEIEQNKLRHKNIINNLKNLGIINQ